MNKLKLTVLLLLLSLCQLQIAFSQKAQVADQIIGKVDNFIILESDLALAQKEYISRGYTSDDASYCKVLEDLVVNKLMLAKAVIDSVVVGDQQVDAQVENRMKMMVNQIGSEEKIEEYYGKTLEEFKVEIRDDIKEQMVVGEMQRTITQGVKVTPKEVQNFFKNIPKDSLPYYSTQVQVGQIVRDPKMSREAKNSVKSRLEGLRERIIDGEDFEELARLYSQEPGAKKTGGNIGFFQRGELAPEYEAAALRLKQGEISKPVETDFGFHLIQLIERRGNEFNTRHILIRPRFTQKDIDLAINFLDSLRINIMGDSLSFEKAAKEYSDDMNTSSSGGYFLDPESQSTKISVEDLDPNVFFTIDTMKLGSITKPLVFNKQDGSEAVRILFYKHKIRPHQADIQLDYQRIQKAALNKKKSETLNKWFKEAKSEVFVTVDEKYKSCNILNQ